MNSSCYIILISLILDLLAFTIILPLMPSILDYYETNDKSGLYNQFNSIIETFRIYCGAPNDLNKVLLAGAIGSWFSFLQFISSPFIGAFSDVYGRRVSMIICLVGITISHLIWSLSSGSFLLFTVARTLGGLFKGNVSLSTAIVTDLLSQSERGKGMALIGVAFSIGFIFGPLIGAFFSYYSKTIISSGQHFFALPAITSTILAAINLIFIYIYFKESLAKSNRAKSTTKGLIQAFGYVNPISLFGFTNVQKIRSEELKTIRDLGFIYFLYLFFYSGLEYTLTFLTHHRFGYTRMQQAKIYLFSGILMALLQGTYVRRIKPSKELGTITMGLMVIIIAFLTIGLSQTIPQLYTGLAFYSFSSAAVVPCLTTLASSTGPLDQKGTILGTFRSLGSLARALGPIISSLTYWRFGAVISYSIGAIFFIFPLLLSKSLTKRLNAQKIKLIG
ncbi:major facilitator superfamily domain-containing protein 10-like [Panonychus citri]|uniref:major facilitator superfamily domain-containing protein 10-like n=1 Tax=Panonychus citri TaxID=50023 RepID=UPI002307B02D|nr:major facilitator superfamily domain-containing protein 10-like [Panonychus citri]